MLCTCAFVSRKKAQKLLTCCKLPSTKQQSLALRVTWTVYSNICSINMSNCLRAYKLWVLLRCQRCDDSCSGFLWMCLKERFRWSHWQGQKQDHRDPGDSGRRGWRGSKEEGRRKEEAPETSRKASCKSLNACWTYFKLLKYPESVRTESMPYISRVYNILGWPGVKQYLMLFEENCLPCTWVILILTPKWAYSCAPRLLKHAFSG